MFSTQKRDYIRCFFLREPELCTDFASVHPEVEIFWSGSDWWTGSELTDTTHSLYEYCTMVDVETMQVRNKFQSNDLSQHSWLLKAFRFLSTGRFLKKFLTRRGNTVVESQLKFKPNQHLVWYTADNLEIFHHLASLASACKTFLLCLGKIKTHKALKPLHQMCLTLSTCLAVSCVALLSPSWAQSNKAEMPLK